MIVDKNMVLTFYLSSITHILSGKLLKGLKAGQGLMTGRDAVTGHFNCWFIYMYSYSTLCDYHNIVLYLMRMIKNYLEMSRSEFVTWRRVVGDCQSEDEHWAVLLNVKVHWSPWQHHGWPLNWVTRPEAADPGHWWREMMTATPIDAPLKLSQLLVSSSDMSGGMSARRFDVDPTLIIMIMRYPPRAYRVNHSDLPSTSNNIKQS